MDSHDVFVRCQELAGEFDICKGHYHTNDRGDSCPPEEAVSHCAVGIVHVATRELGCPELMPEVLTAIHGYLQLEPGLTITGWNDEYGTPGEVRAMFRTLAGNDRPVITHEVHEAQEVLALV